jgi:hypothetical protein
MLARAQANKQQQYQQDKRVLCLSTTFVYLQASTADYKPRMFRIMDMVSHFKQKVLPIAGDKCGLGLARVPCRTSHNRRSSVLTSIVN